MTISHAARDQVRNAIVDLMRCEPERWPEMVAAEAAAACVMKPGPLTLLADAAVQFAATAHWLQQESEKAEDN